MWELLNFIPEQGFIYAEQLVSFEFKVSIQQIWNNRLSFSLQD